ncbi:MAG: SdrD B-like domain-containing protein, partial [Cyanobacteria bacterium J06639_1]
MVGVDSSGAWIAQASGLNESGFELPTLFPGLNATLRNQTPPSALASPESEATFSNIVAAEPTSVAAIADSSTFTDIVGSEQRDALVGTDDSDRILGLQRGDTLTGGASRDHFTFVSLNDRGDVITDFELDIDQLDFTDLLREVSYEGVDPFGDGYLSVSEFRGVAVVSVDADGAAGPDRFRPFVSVEGVTVAELLSNPEHFIPFPPAVDIEAPVISANLVNDTGRSESDRLTNDASVDGTVVDNVAVTEFTAQLNGSGALVDVLDSLQADGSFTFAPKQLAEILGSTLVDGAYTLQLSARDASGNTSAFSLDFILDTTIAIPMFDFDPAFDTEPVGDRQTEADEVTFIGQTDSDALVELEEAGTFAPADEAGTFAFEAIALPLGESVFTATAEDAAGNAASFEQTFTRVEIDTEVPMISASLLEDSGLPGDRLTNNPAIVGRAVDDGILSSFAARLDETTEYVDVLATVDINGDFSLSPEQLATIFGRPLADGSYTVQFLAEDDSGNEGTFEFDFALDTTPPPIELGFATETSASTLTLFGVTEPDLTISLAPDNLVSVSDSTGAFSFEDIPLELGENPFTFTAIDLAGNRGSVSQTVERGVLNQAPEISAPNDFTVLEDEVGSLDGIAIADVDAGDGLLEVSLTVENGTLTLGTLEGLSFSQGTGVNDAAIAFQGNLADINAALASLFYLSDLDFNGADSLSIAVNDLGNSGLGGSQTDDETVGIAVSPTPDTNAIEGHVFIDDNGNAIFDDSELGQSGVTVFLDLNQNGFQDADEPSQLSDSNGRYEFSGAPSGSYLVWQEVPEGFEQTAPESFFVPVELEGGTTLEDVNFGNQEFIFPSGTGEISGFKWEDINANGVRDTELIQGSDPDVIFVIDVSGSADFNFVGSDIGDFNNDGRRNTRLDAEIAGFIALNDQLVAQGLGDSAEVGIVVFSGFSAQADMNTTADGIQLLATPLADEDGNGVSDVEDILRSLRSGAFGVGNNTGTNFEVALRDVEDTFNTVGTPVGSGNVVFLSDGEVNRGGSLSDEIERLSVLGVNISAFGVGSNASLPDLRNVDPDAEIFITAEELIGVFSDLDGGEDIFVEPTIEGFTVYLDLDEDGQLDPNEPTQITDADGNYRFTGLAAGDYQVREIQQSGFNQIFPFAQEVTAPDGSTITVPGFHTVTVTEGEISDGFNFGNKQRTGEIRGVKWEDINGDGIFDDDESTLQGVTVYLDLNQNGRIDINEPNQQTDENGRYRFRDLDADTYVVREVVPFEFLQTQPGRAFIERTTSLDVQGTDAIYLAGRDDVTIPPLGSSNPTFPLLRHSFVRGDFLQETFPQSIDAVPDEIFSFEATGSIDFFNGSGQGFPTPDGGAPAGSSLSGIAGISGYAGPEGPLVGVFLDANNPQNLPAPAALNFTPAGLGAGFSRLAPELGQVFFIGDGRTGTGDGDTQEFTAPDGATRLFLGLADGFGFDGIPGAYDDNDGFYSVDVRSLRPGEPDGYTIDLGIGEVVEDINFGNIRNTEPLNGEVRGVKWNDLNGDGIRDRDPGLAEPGLKDWLIYIDADNDGVRDVNERFTLTNDNGEYTFADLDPGTYVIREELQPGWVQTSSPLAQTVTIVDGDLFADIDFGNQFTLAGNEAPEFISAPVTIATPGELYQYDVEASDPEGTTVTYALRNGFFPTGMAIDSTTGLIEWQVDARQSGSFPVTVMATDADGVQFSQSFLIATSDLPGGGTSAPEVAFGFSTNSVAIGEDFTLQVQGIDGDGLASLELTANGVPVALDSNDVRSGAVNGSTLQFTEAGLVELIATATDANGNVGTETLTIRVTDPNDMTAPVPELDLSQFEGSGSVITAPVDILGAVEDDGLEFYRLEIAPVDLVNPNNPTAPDPDYRVLAEGTESISGVLGQVDPTLLANGNYFLRVITGDVSGNVDAQGTTVAIAGELKPGRFTQEFVDISIPVAGLPIEVTRVYDSLEANRSGDFGFGWSLGEQDARIQESVPVTDFDGFGLFTATSFSVGDTVTLTNPDGNRVTFTFEPFVSSFVPFLGPIWSPRFVPEEGVFDTLEVDNSSLTVRPDGTVSTFFFPFPYNPSEYRLTTRDGTTYQYDQFDGLETVTDRNGNTLTYTDNGIFSSTGESVEFRRDSQGRITEIIDPSGNAIKYGYDANGDLSEINDRESNVTELVYEEPQLPHYLSDIIDPLGRGGIRNEYDDRGRLVRLIDADGNALDVAFDSANSQTVTDPLGNTITFIFDDRGNLVQQVDAEGGITLSTYDENNNLLNSCILFAQAPAKAKVAAAIS